MTKKFVVTCEDVLNLLTIHPYTMSELTKTLKTSNNIITQRIHQLRKNGHTIEYERHYNQYFLVKPRTMEEILADMKRLVAEATKLMEK
jgi:predicted transcriptional regulator